MKHRTISISLLALAMTMAMSTSAFAASPDEPLLSGSSTEQPEICYPTYVAQSEDGTELRKYYDLGPEDDPAGIPRSDFEQDGFHYTLTDLLKQELPEYEERLHTETVSVASKSKDMATVLSVLPEKKEFITEDGFTGTLTLKLESVQVEVSGYGSTTKEISATRTYPNLSDQDTQFIPKTIEQDGKTLTLQNIEWQTDNTATVDGYAMGDRYTAVATYTGSKTSSYVKGYTVTAEYSGTVSRIALNKVRYVAIFEGVCIAPVEEEPLEDIVPTDPPVQEPGEAPESFNWPVLLVPLGVIVAAGGGIGIALFMKRRRESDESEGDAE